jgi:hypothetical protein
MIAIAFLFICVLCDCFKSRWRLEAEILVLRHQLNVLQQRAPRRLHLWASPRIGDGIPSAGARAAHDRHAPLRLGRCGQRMVEVTWSGSGIDAQPWPSWLSAGCRLAAKGPVPCMRPATRW